MLLMEGWDDGNGDGGVEGWRDERKRIGDERDGVI
jgi:hypothetical protein